MIQAQAPTARPDSSHGSSPGLPELDGIDAAAEGLQRRLAGGTEADRVLADFIEDDLREGRQALSEVADHFADLVAALGAVTNVAVVAAGPSR